MRVSPPKGTASGSEPKGKLYETVAKQILAMIEGGTFQPGDRLPSVRALHAQLGVSVTTVLGAYRILEDRAAVTARPQSGYYVRSPHEGPAGRRDRAIAPEPTASRPSISATKVSTRDLVMLFLRERSRQGLSELGMAFPPARFLPTGKLNRLLAAVGRANPERATDYAMPPGVEALRLQIARRSLASGCSLTPDDIVITCGAQEALTLCLRATCRAGDTVAVESPMYFGVWQALDMLGLRAVEVAMHPREGMSLDALEKVLQRHKVRAVVSSPTVSNPLGSSMPEAKKKQLVQLLGGREIPLIEDDVYGELVAHPGRGGDERPHAAKAFDEKGLVLLCSSFTKTLAPGFRIGWVVPGRYKTALNHLKFATSLATPTLQQLAVAEFLATGGYERHLRRLRRVFRKNVGLNRAAISRYFPDGAKVTRPAGGFVLWVELPAAVDALRVYEVALENGITIAPGPMFSAQGKYRNCIRLNAAMWSREIEASLIKLGELAEQA